MRKYTLALACFLAALPVLARPAAADSKRIVIVVAKSSSMRNISKSDLRHCFLGEPLEDGGLTLAPFNANPGTPERTGFDSAVLGMSPDQVGRYWVDRKIRGQSGAPRALPSPAHVAKVVAKFPGAIGYLAADQLTADVIALKVDGVAFADPGYAIATP